MITTSIASLGELLCFIALFNAGIMFPDGGAYSLLQRMQLDIFATGHATAKHYYELQS